MGALDFGDVAHLLPNNYKRTIASWLAEDDPSFDYGGFVVGEDPRTATLYMKSPVTHLPSLSLSFLVGKGPGQD